MGHSPLVGIVPFADLAVQRFQWVTQGKNRVEQRSKWPLAGASSCQTHVPRHAAGRQSDRYGQSQQS
jgi:hypothetical protein